MKSVKITFTNKNGYLLSGILDLPDNYSENNNNNPKDYAIFAHCFTCTKNIKAAHHISQSLTLANIAVLRFDFTGLGESDGDFADTNFSSNIDDIIAAAEYLNSHYQSAKILIGHSLGGTAVLQAAHAISSVVAIATIAAPSSPAHLAKLLATTSDEISQSGQASVTIGPKIFNIKQQLLDDLEQTKMTTTIKQLSSALLILHSPKDAVVAIDNAAEIFQLARHPKSFISLDQADHLLSESSESRYVGNLIAAWAVKYLSPQAPTPAQRFSDSDYHTIVTSIDTDKYPTQLSVRHHHCIADEPESLGGQDLGPSPYEYLLGALGACTCITLRMYADKKSWSLDGVKVVLKHQKIHAHDCEGCEQKDGRIDRIERNIELSGNLSQDQRTRLIEIANKCPVHKTLHADIVIETQLMV